MQPPAGKSVHGRGAAANPRSRFVPLTVLRDPDVPDDEQPLPRTQFLIDSSRSIITCNDSPDVPFEFSINPYRGCEHGCIYCYARPTHEYLDFSAGLEFETKILVKKDAPDLLRTEMNRKTWQPKVVSMSGVTDPYQPVERHLRLTRRCLEVFAEFRNPVTIVTKNHRIVRDIDILAELARLKLTVVHISITTLNPDLTRIMEPRTASPRLRMEAIRELSAAGVPAGVLVAPVIPGLTDHEMPAILEAAAKAGATMAGFQPVRLPYAVAGLFADWLQRHMPDRKEKVLNRIRDMRGGKLNDANFGSRMRGQGIFAEQMRSVFKLSTRRLGLDGPGPSLRLDLFRRVDRQQPGLFE